MIDPSGTHTRWRLWPILFGLVVGVVIYVLLGGREGLSPEARTVAAVGGLMAAWWMTEALPIEVTGLVPLALFPLLRAVPIDKAAPPYADKIIFLFLGGMLLGQAMERWDLHKRFALRTVSLLGSSPPKLVGAFLLATAFISMWVSNTAATIMMLPIGASVVVWMTRHTGEDGALSRRQVERELGPAIVLAIAFGASIGGVGTVIGTPPIAQYTGFVNKLVAGGGPGTPITFLSWLKLGLPTLAIILPVTWLVLTRIAFKLPRGDVPAVRAHLREELRSLGPMTVPQWLTLLVFGSAALFWVVGQWLKVDDAVIGIAAGILLFIVPVREGPGLPHRPLLTWREAERVPWGILLLFGGGLSLAEAIKTTGVDRFIAQGADGLTGVPVLPLLWIVAMVTIVLTEFTTNTALVAAGLPVAEAIATRLGVPTAAVLVTMTLTASLGFMLPAGTAPNALVFASGRVTMGQMMRAGVWLDASCAFVVPLLVVGAMKMGILPGLP